MNILVLDSQKVIHQLFDKFLSEDHAIVHTFNCEQAIRAISETINPFDIAFLGYNLDDCIFEENGDKLNRHGTYFIKYILSYFPKDKLSMSFIIHSYDDVGSNTMHFLLQANGLSSTLWKFSGDMLRTIAHRLKK